MKIAYLSCVLPPYPGGIGVAAAGMATEMARRGHEVAVFTPYELRTHREHTNKRSISYVRTSSSVRTDIGVCALRPLLKYGHAALLPQVLWCLRNFDIIHLLYPFYGVAELTPLLRRTTRAKIVVHHLMDAVAPGFKGRVFAWHARRIMPRIFRTADAVLALSEDYARNSEVAKLGVTWEVVPHGIDTTLFRPPPHPNPSPSGRGQGEGAPRTVLFVGGLDRAHYFKGVPVLLQACRILRERRVRFQCQIVGDGEMRKGYEELAAPLLNPPPLVGGGKVGGSDTQFVGLVPHDQLPVYYQRASICVVPSTEPIECFSIVAAEAQACGIPVIVTDFPGVRVTIEQGKTGFVIPSGNVPALAERIQWLLEHPQEARAMGTAGRVRAEQLYSWKVVGDKLEAVYRSL